MNGTRLAWVEMHLILYSCCKAGDNHTECGSVEELPQVHFRMSHLLFTLSTIQCNVDRRGSESWQRSSEKAYKHSFIQRIQRAVGTTYDPLSIQHSVRRAAPLRSVQQH